ncbi:hypothetical protein F4560_001022 [Saccharothrix ecbatanensis]|jgi:hypothetical protein|uniref:Uncharacterized protein n=1 Tax=Saccharothrix ecbatanensis TaxID=1105145 RepID=A0A7W9LYV6_9PSEU|nr:hypothetical protein [Saccharothrix ecbatanensis]MBB5801254.1 hypothetical protein [Saccharothrix ecbatanensis]
MWQYALWGLVGAASNCGVVFLEASRRVKGWPWARPRGPGGGVYAASILVHLGLGALTAGALADSLIVTNSFVAFGTGVAAVALVKKAGSYALTTVSSTKDDDQQEEQDDHRTADRGDDHGA